MNTTPLILHEPPIQEALLPSSIPWLWVALGACTIIALATLIFVIIAKRRKPIDPAAVRRAALAQSLREIEEAASLPPRIAALQTSLAIRRYMATAAGDPSLFETHEEFLARHPAITLWPPDTVHSLVSTLKHLAELKYRPLEDSQTPADFLTQSRSLLQSLDTQSAA